MYTCMLFMKSLNVNTYLQLNSENRTIVHTELIDEDGESRYKITDIIG